MRIELHTIRYFGAFYHSQLNARERLRDARLIITKALFDTKDYGFEQFVDQILDVDER